MLKKKKRKIKTIEITFVLCKIKKKILNLTKNNPKGGNPVNIKSNQK